MLPMTTLIFGLWMKFISSSMVPDAECGFRPSAKTPLCCIIQREKALATMVPCACVMENCFINGKPTLLMLKPIGSS